MPDASSEPVPTAEPADRSASRDDFYVGYLPLPRSHRRWLRVAVPVLLWVAAIIAGVASFAQRSPGDAVWSDATPVTLDGVLFADPYPYLLPEGGPPIFLVEIGKHSARPRVTPLAGRRASVTGWTLERDGRRILELIPEPAALAPRDSDPTFPPAWRSLGPATFSGEIVDYKCYLGAMKPGDGKSHKACATLCIANGIPPMLVSREPDGTPRYTLLLGPDGAPPPPELLAHIAETVIVRGTLGEFAGQRVIRASSIESVGRHATTR